MDLFECPGCEQRFVVSAAVAGVGLRCPEAGHELRLVASSLPGTPREIETALGASALTVAGDLTCAAAA